MLVRNTPAQQLSVSGFCMLAPSVNFVSRSLNHQLWTSSEPFAHFVLSNTIWASSAALALLFIKPCKVTGPATWESLMLGFPAPLLIREAASAIPLHDGHRIDRSHVRESWLVRLVRRVALAQRNDLPSLIFKVMSQCPRKLHGRALGLASSAKLTPSDSLQFDKASHAALAVIKIGRGSMHYVGSTHKRTVWGTTTTPSTDHHQQSTQRH